MTSYVQIVGCFDSEDADIVPFVSHEDAEFYGIYFGRPGEYQWQADFLHYEDALAYALAANAAHGYIIDDKTFNDEDFKNARTH